MTIYHQFIPSQLLTSDLSCFKHHVLAELSGWRLVVVFLVVIIVYDQGDWSNLPLVPSSDLSLSALFDSERLHCRATIQGLSPHWTISPGSESEVRVISGTMG